MNNDSKIRIYKSSESVIGRLSRLPEISSSPEFLPIYIQTFVYDLRLYKIVPLVDTMEDLLLTVTTGSVFGDSVTTIQIHCRFE